MIFGGKKRMILIIFWVFQALYQEEFGVGSDSVLDLDADLYFFKMPIFAEKRPKMPLNFGDFGVDPGGRIK